MSVTCSATTCTGCATVWLVGMSPTVAYGEGGALLMYYLAPARRIGLDVAVMPGLARRDRLYETRQQIQGWLRLGGRS
jgi:hypothetical protein